MNIVSKLDSEKDLAPTHKKSQFNANRTQMWVNMKRSILHSRTKQLTSLMNILDNRGRICPSTGNNNKTSKIYETIWTWKNNFQDTGHKAMKSVDLWETENKLLP